MSDMQQVIVVHAPTLTIVVGPFSGEDAADEWIAEKRKNPNGYLGVVNGSNLSFEVLPLQPPALFRGTNPAQQELPLKTA
jgi:hypothetical protein